MDTMVNLEQASEQLGVSIHTLRGWVMTRQIDFVKVGPGGRNAPLRIRQSTIDRMLEEGSVTAASKRKVARQFPRMAREQVG